MKPETTLKDEQKPLFAPRDYPDKDYVIYGLSIGVNRNISEQIAEWYKRDRFKPFIISALNEEWEREFGEPLRWIEEKYEHSTIVTWDCPKCEEGYAVGRAERQRFYYCPKCGVKLSPPKTLYWKWADSGNEYVCPSCGHEAEDDESHCPSCGVRLLLPGEDGK